MSADKPSYWAVLPAAVRYDPKIPASAKLLYAEISSLTDGRGFCWASNAYFERLYDLSERTIIRLIRALEAAGYIRIQDGAGGTATRKIYAGVNPMGTDSHASAAAPTRNDGETETPDKNVSTPRQKCQGGGDKNVTHNKKDIKRKNSPPTAPQGAAHEPEMFERFWKAYPCKKDKASARREWDRLEPDRKLMQIMSAALERQKASDMWQREIGIPYACRWLKNRRWEDGDDQEFSSAPAAEPPREEALPWI